MLRERGSGELVGNAGVFHSYRGLGEDFDDSPEAGWILRADRVGQGLAHEAMTAALAWFEREHGRRRIVCMITPETRRRSGSPNGSGSRRCARRSCRTARPSGCSSALPG